LGTPVPSPYVFPSPQADVVIYAVKNTNAKARVELKVWDAANNIATVDPIVANLEIKNGRSLARRFTKIPQAERYVRLQNGTPGLNSASLWINGRLVSSGSLTSGQTVDLDVVQWLRPGNRNTATIQATGLKGATAILTVGDVPTGGSAIASARVAGGKLNLEFSR
jgi:hypothetical protein